MAWCYPEEAWTRLNAMDVDASQRGETLENIFSAFGHQPENRELAESLIARMDSEEEREVARREMLEGLNTRLVEHGGVNPTQVAGPAEWLDSISAISGVGEVDLNVSWTAYAYLHLVEASIYASKLSYTDPRAAGDWVATLPAGEAKSWAQRKLARNWFLSDAPAAEQWLQSLPHATRTEIREFIDGKQ